MLGKTIIMNERRGKKIRQTGKNERKKGEEKKKEKK